MIQIQIHGLSDGEHTFEISELASKIPHISAEFDSIINVTGVVKKLGKRIQVNAIAATDATLVCDRSLEEFTEKISITLSLQYTLDNTLAALQHKQVEDIEDGQTRAIREEQKFIDISEDIRQELMLALPMRRIAPQYRDVDLDKVFPGVSVRAESDSLDSTKLDVDLEGPWAALKKLKK